MSPETTNQVAASVAGAGAATVSAWTMLNEASIPFIGIPLIGLSMAVTGALVSFGVGAPITNRRKMFKVAGVNAMLGATLTAILPAALNWEWMTPGLQAPLAFGFSLSLRWVVPIAIDLAPDTARGALRKFFGIRVYSRGARK
jgi:hypothetical protein